MRKLRSGNIQRQSMMLWSARRHARFLVRHLSARRLANAARCLREMRERRALLHSHPFYLRVGASQVCNLRCPGCLITQRAPVAAPAQPRLMPFEVFEEALRDFLPWLLKVNLYDEGEPLLNSDLLRMTRHLRRHRVGSCVSSNFSLPLAADFLEEVVAHGPDHLVVCVDGATQETYERYRVGGRLGLVLENLDHLLAVRRAFRSRRPYVEMQFIEFDHNRHELPRVADLARSKGVSRFVVVQGSSPLGWAGTNFTGSESERRRRGCYQLWVGAHVNCDGSLATCDYGEDHGIPGVGWARDYRARDLRNHPRLVALRASFRQEARLLDPVCLRCSLYQRV